MRIMVQSAQSSYDAERLHEMAERLGQEQDFKSYDDDIDLDAVDAAYAAGGRGWTYSEYACFAAPVFDGGSTRDR